MTHRLDTVKHLVMAAVTCAVSIAQLSCNSIDDDLSDCGTDASVTYEMRLITNMDDELATELGEPADAPVAQALRTHLSPIFTDLAHDLDLAFYHADDASAPSLPLLHHEQHVIDAPQASYTIYLPQHRYQNLALANLDGNAVVTLANAGDGASAALVTAAVTAPQPPHTTGLFTARLPMDLSSQEPHSYHAYLYMANSAAALVVDTTGVVSKAITVAISGLADRFLINDSTYSYENNIVASCQEVKAASGHQACFCTVAFPSRNTVSRASAEGTLWTVTADVDMPDGTTTHNVINVYQPLKAACLKVIKVKMQADGSFQPVTTEVGVSTSLNWRKGGDYEI